jgi:hypothetical protein
MNPMKMSIESLRTAVDRSWKNMHSVCGLDSCRNTMLIRSVPQRRVGVQVGELWYCSVDCFVESAHARLSELCDERVVAMPHRPRLPLGLVMVSKDFLTGDQLRFATAQSQLHGEELETALLRLGLANERQLASARATQWGCLLAKQNPMGQPVEADIPPALLRATHAVPLHYSATAGRLLLGFVYRVEHTLLHALEQMMGCKAEPCFITPSEFEHQMTRITAVPNYEEVVMEGTMTPAQMAKTLGRMAVQVAAREARFVHCSDYIWTRLSGKLRRVDVLFRVRQEAPVEKTENLLFQERNIGAWG